MLLCGHKSRILENTNMFYEMTILCLHNLKFMQRIFDLDSLNKIEMRSLDHVSCFSEIGDQEF